MRRRGKLLVGVFTTAMLVAVGCTERVAPTLPEAPTAPSLSRGGNGGGNGVGHHRKVAGRKHVVRGRVSVSAEIGQNGGTLVLKDEGLRVEIPRGAIPLARGQRSIEITVTAVPGASIAYEFEPHGLVFEKPILLVQDLRGTDLEADDVLAGLARGAYFEGGVKDGFADLLEIRPTDVDVKHKKLYFSVEHFSGYLVAVG
jgi:hypothetical protein